MTWLLAAHRWRSVLVISATGGLVAGALRGRNAPVPSLTQGVIAPVPVLAVLALVPVVALLWGWSGLPCAALAAPVRRSGPLLLALAVPALLVFTASAAVAGALGAALECGRDAMGLLGLAVLGLYVAGEGAALVVPIGYLLASFLVGRPSGGATSRTWAWILRDGGDVTALALALALAGLGAAVLPRIPAALVRR